MRVKVKTPNKGREVVALVFCSHFVMKGLNAKAVFLTSDSSASPLPNTAFVHSGWTFEDLLINPNLEKVIYKGDKVTLQF